MSSKERKNFFRKGLNVIKNERELWGMGDQMVA